MTLWWEIYYETWCCLWVWNLAPYVDGRTQAEGIREWADEEDILI